MAATVAALFVGGLLGWRGRHLARMLSEQARLESQLAQLRQQNEQARNERRALLSSPEAIEMVAREDYGFAAPGEKVTEFPAPRGPVRAYPHQKVQVPLWQKVLMSPLLPLAVPAVVFVVTAFVLRRLDAASAAQAGPVA